MLTWIKSLPILLVLVACGEGEDSKKKNYSFKAAASQKLKSSSVIALTAGPGVYQADDLCTSVICITPDNVTGEYFGAGLLIQASGSGMSAYFDHESWSSITTATDTKAFNLGSPLTHAGNLFCCGGEGDMSSENTYFSDASFMFQYLDVSFTVPASLSMRGSAVGSHQIRFILADDAFESAKRGDIMVEDTAFKWMNQDGTLTTTRPTNPITMNDKVVNWTSPFGDGKGNTEIPVIYSGLTEPSNGKQVTSETDLKKSATYTFDFNAAGLVIFPDLLHADGGMVGDLKTLLSKIHIRGFAYGNRDVIGLAKTTLTLE